jgi:DNA-binding CsgD family transcriptional regulator
VNGPTPRQLEVLRVCIEEGSRKRAAYRLGISGYTLRNHLTELYGRLGVTTEIEALRELGWLTVPEAA